MNIILVGAGAIGCFYASRLHHVSQKSYQPDQEATTKSHFQPQHDIRVSIVARSNFKAASTSGIHLITRSWGEYDFHPAAVYPSVAAAAATEPPKEWHYVVIATKALPDRLDEASLIAPLISNASSMVLLQNGVGIEEPYRQRFPATPIVSGIAFMSAEQIQPGTVRQNLGTRLVLGPYVFAPAGTNEQTPQQEAARDLAARGAASTAHLAKILTDLGGLPDVEAHADPTPLQTAQWRKLAINAALNPSAVLSGGRGSGEMARDEELRSHLAGVMREIWDAVPRILGAAPSADEAERPEAVLDLVARASGARPSMLQDWEAGRPLEIEVILGNPVRIARARGVELPRTQTLYALMRSAQALRDGKLGGVDGKL